jgi:hypothetical protein
VILVSIPPFGATVFGVTLAMVGGISVFVTVSEYFANPTFFRRISGFHDPASNIETELTVSKTHVISLLALL